VADVLRDEEGKEMHGMDALTTGMTNEQRRVRDAWRRCENRNDLQMMKLDLAASEALWS